MKRSLLLWQVSGLTFSAVLGTLFHFLYDWTGFILFAPFSAVNESTWEHMKLLFFPSFIFAIIQSVFFLKDYPLFWRIKLIGIMVGLLIIPTLFYTYNGAIGKSPDWFNISIFFIALIAEYFFEYRQLKSEKTKSPLLIFSIVSLAIITFLFIIFSFYPPNLPLFTPPII